MASPTITGTVANQPVTGTNTIKPFSSVTFGDADGDELDVIINLNALDIPGGVREGDFTAASVAASGFTFNSGIGNWSFHGTAAQATAAIRQLVWDPNGPIGGDGISHLEITVTDGANFSFNFGTTVQWTAGNTNDPPVITSDGGGKNATVQILENKKVVTDVEATDPEGEDLTYSIVDGLDGDLFGLSTKGRLFFLAAPDFENPADADKDNIYRVKVKVADADGLSDTQTIFVNVNDVLGVTINGTNGPDVVDQRHTVDGEPSPTPEGDTIRGKNKGDFLSGLGGADILFGDGGNDTLVGGDSGFVLVGDKSKPGVDLLDGGDGLDTADYSDNSFNLLAKATGEDTLAVKYKLKVGGVSLVFNEDLIKNIENLTGGDGDDQLGGNEEANILKGNGGDDKLFAVANTSIFEDGADELYGGQGNDSLFIDNGGVFLHGERGADVFVFETIPAAVFIEDFSHGQGDRIALDLKAFGRLGENANGTGTLQAKFFHLGKPGDDDDLAGGICYARSSGDLYYFDPKQVFVTHLFGHISNDAKLQADDFFIA